MRAIFNPASRPTMHYTFLSAYCVQGIAHPIGEADVTLFEDQMQGIRVLLTTNAIFHLHFFNRHAALMTMMLSAGIGDSLEKIQAETEKVASSRKSIINNDPVILIYFNGDVDAQVTSPSREIQDFIICFDAFDRKTFKAEIQSKISAILTALRIGTREPLKFRHVTEGVYLTTEDGRIVHSAFPEVSAFGAYQSQQLTDEQKDQIIIYLPLILKIESLERVMQLHAQSFSKTTDNYRAFVAAWSALEILIAKFFKIYQPLLASELRALNQSPGLHDYLDRISNVMSDKYSLTDKFSVVSVYLDDTQAEDEVRIFRHLKGIRDKLSHGEDLDELTLPTKDVQRLFDKYLRNHLHRSNI